MSKRIHICGQPDSECDMDCVERAYRSMTPAEQARKDVEGWAQDAEMWPLTLPMKERLANLIAILTPVYELVDGAIAEEREACARVAENSEHEDGSDCNWHCNAPIAAAIRARGGKP